MRSLPLLSLALLLPAPRPQDAAPQDAPPERAAEEDAAAPLPDGVAATIDGVPITLDEYKDYLLRLYGTGPLDELVLTRLLEREAERVGVEVGEAEIDARVAEVWEGYLVRFRGDEEAMRRELRAAGFSPETYRSKLREETRRDLLEERLCVALREVTEGMVAERFEREYGEGGVRVEVRHVLLNRARTRAELREEGVPEAQLTTPRIDVAMRERAAALLGRLRGGEDFETVARRHSHDLSVHQNGGTIPGYNYERYGPSLAEAVRAAAVGEVVGPVETPAGLHLVQVVSRTTTDLRDVHEELVRELVAEPASWPERNALRARLRREAEVRTFR